MNVGENTTVLVVVKGIEGGRELTVNDLMLLREGSHVWGTRVGCGMKL